MWVSVCVCVCVGTEWRWGTDVGECVCGGGAEWRWGETKLIRITLLKQNLDTPVTF